MNKTHIKEKNSCDLCLSAEKKHCAHWEKWKHHTLVSTEKLCWCHLNDWYFYSAHRPSVSGSLKTVRCFCAEVCFVSADFPAPRCRKIPGNTQFLPETHRHTHWHTLLSWTHLHWHLRITCQPLFVPSSWLSQHYVDPEVISFLSFFLYVFPDCS